MDIKIVLIAFGTGLISFLAGYAVARARARGLYRQAEELCDCAGKVLEEISKKAEELNE